MTDKRPLLSSLSMQDRTALMQSRSTVPTTVVPLVVPSGVAPAHGVPRHPHQPGLGLLLASPTKVTAGVPQMAGSAVPDSQSTMVGSFLPTPASPNLPEDQDVPLERQGIDIAVSLGLMDDDDAVDQPVTQSNVTPFIVAPLTASVTPTPPPEGDEHWCQLRVQAQQPSNQLTMPRDKWTPPAAPPHMPPDSMFKYLPQRPPTAPFPTDNPGNLAAWVQSQRFQQELAKQKMTPSPPAPTVPCTLTSNEIGQGDLGGPSAPELSPWRKWPSAVNALSPAAPGASTPVPVNAKIPLKKEALATEFTGLFTFHGIIGPMPEKVRHIAAQTTCPAWVPRATFSDMPQAVSSSIVRSRTNRDPTQLVPLPVSTSSKSRPAADQQAGMLQQNMLQSQLKGTKTADLLFLIDATGSMTPTIQAAKDKILQMVMELESAPPPLDGWKVRLGFIAYRDFNIQPHFEIQDFTPSTAQFSLALAKLKTYSMGQNDFTEDVFGGIEIATLFSWESASRTIVHIADAPCHGSEYHDLGAVNDHHYLTGDPLKRNLAELFLNLKMDCQVSLYMFMHVDRSVTTKMLQQFKKISGLNELGHQWLQETDLGNVENKELVKKMVTTVQRSIRHANTCLSMPAVGSGNMQGEMRKLSAAPDTFNLWNP